MALIRFNHLSKCKGSQTNVSVILPTDGFPEKRAGVSCHRKLWTRQLKKPVSIIR